MKQLLVLPITNHGICGSKPQGALMVRSIKCAPGTPGDLVVGIKLFSWNGCASWGSWIQSGNTIHTNAMAKTNKKWL